MPQSRALGGSLYQAGNIRRDKGFIVIAHHPEIGRKRSKMIIGDFRLGCGNFTQKRTFPNIGEAHQSHVGNHFHFEDDVMLFDFFSLLRKIGGVPSRGRKTNVAFSAVPAAGDENFLSVLEYVADQPVRLRIAHQRSQRNFDIDILSALSRTLIRAALFPVFGKKFPGKAEGKQIVHVLIAHEIHVSAAAAVAPVRTARGFALKCLEGIHSVAAVAGFDKDFYFIRKFAVCHNYPQISYKISLFSISKNAEKSNDLRFPFRKTFFIAPKPLFSRKIKFPFQNVSPSAFSFGTSVSFPRI